jgi:DNA polymerase III subunit alpha
MNRFVHLHLHTKYSLLDGMCKIDALIAAARKNSMIALAITDHGNMYGAVDFYTTVAGAGIKPIIGMETYIVEDASVKTREKNHIVLLVKNEEGYKNLMRIATFAATEGFYYKPTIDKKFLKEHSKGIIGLSACLQGEIPYKIVNGDIEGAKNSAAEYRDIFGEGNFYLELQNHGMAEEQVMNKGLREISKAMSLPLVATNDVHYMEKEDAKAHDILLCIQTATTVKEADRMQFHSKEFYFKNKEEMLKALPEDEAAITASFDIANMCNFELPRPDKKKAYYMPAYDIEDKSKTFDEYFEEVAHKAFNEKYKKPSDALINRLLHEIKIIKELGYPGYFLIVRDIINHARENNIPVGPGRGSAAGSLVSYVLGITSIDPIKYGLLFERFLNPSRNTPPDIDIDFSDEERDKIVEYIVNKFGRDKTAQIITFQTLKARAAIRDVGRVLDVPLKDVDELAKKVPEVLNISFENILKDREFLEFINDPDHKYREEIVSYAAKIEGLLRQDSTHAAGVVIAPDNLRNFVPLAIPKSKGGDEAKASFNYMTQYSMDSLEKIGLLKFDILGLRNLAVIKRALAMIKQNTGTDVQLSCDDFDDPRVYEMLSEADTMGVFQLESDGMRELLKKIKPTTFEEIIAIISLFRPGPMEMIDDYIALKKGKEVKTEGLQEIKDIPILKETYGIPVYQEQVMQIAVEIAGFTLPEADNLRRAMAKKKYEEMEKIRLKFIQGAGAKGMNAEKAGKIFERLQQFSSYGFNKSHAAAYAVVTYHTAYLKVHYRVEFMAALLSSIMNDIDDVAEYVADVKKDRIDVLGPDVNRSYAEFSVEKGMIRHALAAIKNVGRLAAEEIVRARKEKGAFKDVFDFCEKVTLRSVTSKTIESLVKAGAFDFTLTHRAQLFASIEPAMKDAEIAQKNLAVGQESLFSVESSKPKTINVPEWPDGEMLGYEKEVLGFYVSRHPLARYEKLMKNFAQQVKEVLKGGSKDIQEVYLGGIIHDPKRKCPREARKRSTLPSKTPPAGLR